jgi:hypothetical protein
MKRKLLSGIIGGFIGFVVGVIGGGFLGLVVGGTFLGGLEIYKYTGFEGYELAAYVGAIIGALLATILGVKLALKIASQTEKKM